MSRHTAALAVTRSDLQHGAILFRLRGRILRQLGGELFDVAKSAGATYLGGRLYFVTPAKRYLPFARMDERLQRHRRDKLSYCHSTVCISIYNGNALL